MKALLLALCLAVPVLLGGCAGLPMANPPQVTTLFDDSRFPASGAAPITDVFSLSPAMRAWLDTPAVHTQLRQRGKEQGLVAALYDPGELKLEYDAAQTRTAAEAYDARRGNCLSLVIMTAAFAKALGLEVHYQNVVVDESWRRSGELIVASGHVNLSLGRALMGERSVGAERVLTIDFLPAEDIAGYHSYQIGEDTIVAMFDNNRAVEAMLHGRLAEAYWWARAALLRDPSFGAAYNTLAVVYQRHGDLALAERSWRMALAREPENVVAMRNLAPLLTSLGRNAEADDLARRAAAIEPYPPFHFFKLGMAAMEQRDYATARTQFAREVARAPYHDEFHFWLGIALLRLGEASEAKTQLALALQTSGSAQSSSLYSAKLEQLRRGAAARLQ